MVDIAPKGSDYKLAGRQEGIRKLCNNDNLATHHMCAQTHRKLFAGQTAYLIVHMMRISC